MPESSFQHFGFERCGGGIDDHLGTASRPDKFNQVVDIFGIRFLSHFDQRIPVVFACHPKNAAIIVNIQKDHRIGRTIINRDNPLLVAIPEPKRFWFVLQVVKQGFGPGILVDGAFGDDPQSLDESLVEESCVESFLGFDEFLRQIRVVGHGEMIRPKNLLIPEVLVVEVLSLEPVIRAIGIGRSVEPSAFRRHAAEQHLEETLRHQAEFVAQRYTDRQAANIPLRAFVFRADDQPFAATQVELSRAPVVAVITQPDDFEQIGENIVKNALLRDSGDHLATGNVVLTAVKCLRVKAPGLATADRPFEYIDRPVLLRRSEGKEFGSRAKIKYHGHYLHYY